MKKLFYIVCACVCSVALLSCGEKKKDGSVKQTAENENQSEEKAGDSEWFMAQTDYAPVKTISATSELVEAKFAGKYLYPPVNILDGNFRNTWCEAEDGDGIGESITVEFSEPVSFDEIQIVNGFATKESWIINNRIKSIMITQVAGKHFQQKEYHLEDDVMDWQSIKFNLPQTAQTIEFKIMDIYQGTQYHDTCLDDVRLLYQGRVIPFTGVEELREIQEENSREMLSSDFNQSFKKLFTRPASGGSRKYLVLRGDDGVSGLILSATGEGSSFDLKSMDSASIYNKGEINCSEYGINKNALEDSGASKIAIEYLPWGYPEYKVGNCRIVVTESIDYVKTTTAQLVKINGKNVYINGVHYTVIPSSEVFVAETM